MRSMLSTQEQISSSGPPVTAAPPEFTADTSIDPCSLSRRRLSYETPDQRRASFLHTLVEHNKSSVTFHHETSTSIADKNGNSDLSVYLTPTLSISSSSEHSSSSSNSPTRKTDADESGFSSMGSFQEIGLPSVYPPPNGLPSLHSRCRSTPVTTQATRIQHSYYRNGENATAEIATLEKLKVLWV
ncbi:hypothetical protein B566_EDAN014042 [Ephemera danica]|nr:hypothetical protein B566_EDAN014042 [Ephemera danica]